MKNVIVGFYTSKSDQNGRTVAGNIIKRVSLEKNFGSSNEMSLKFDPKGPITINGSGLMPNRREVVIWTNVDRYV